MASGDLEASPEGSGSGIENHAIATPTVSRAPSRLKGETQREYASLPLPQEGVETTNMKRNIVFAGRASIQGRILVLVLLALAVPAGLIAVLDLLSAASPASRPQVTPAVPASRHHAQTAPPVSRNDLARPTQQAQTPAEPQPTVEPRAVQAAGVVRPESKTIGPAAPQVLAVPVVDDLVVSAGYYDPGAPTPLAEKIPVYPGAIGDNPTSPNRGGASTRATSGRLPFRAYEQEDSFTRFKAKGTIESVLTFYEQAMPGIGWTPDPANTSQPENSTVGTDPWNNWWAAHSRFGQYSWQDPTGAFPYRRQMNLVLTEYEAGIITIEMSFTRIQDLSRVRLYKGAAAEQTRLQTATIRSQGIKYTEQFRVIDFAARAEPKGVQDYYMDLLSKYGYSAALKSNGELWFYYDYLGDRRLSMQLKTAYRGEGETSVEMRIPTDLSPNYR